jgi:hypothetical protein
MTFTTRARYDKYEVLLLSYAVRDLSPGLLLQRRVRHSLIKTINEWPRRYSGHWVSQHWLVGSNPSQSVRT